MSISFRLLIIPLLHWLLAGCGSILANAGAGPIPEDPGARTLAQQLADESIETKAKVNITSSNSGYEEGSFSIISFNGFVLILGQVPTIELKNLATDVVRKLDAVRRIYNELEVGPETSPRVRAKDTWITTKVKSRLLASSDTPGRRVKVATENSIVYLMGLVSEEEADRISIEAGEVNDAQRIVKLFEIIPAPTT